MSHTFGTVSDIMTHSISSGCIWPVFGSTPFLILCIWQHYKAAFPGKCICAWRVSSGIWRRVVRRVSTDVSEEHIASIFGVEEISAFLLLYVLITYHIPWLICCFTSLRIAALSCVWNLLQWPVIRNRFIEKAPHRVYNLTLFLNIETQPASGTYKFFV
jgi:hypothetical protein